MIDTDKYEGHTPAPWRFEYHPIGLNSVRIYALPKILEGITASHRDWTEMEITAVNLGGHHNREEHNMNAKLIADAPLLFAEVKRLSEIEQEWLIMWATLEELNLVADVRENMALHGFVFPTDEDMEGENLE